MTVIPDGIAPIEAYRVWKFMGGALRSLNSGMPWPTSEPLRAECSHGDLYHWTIARDGIPLAEARRQAEEWRGIPVPSVEPPPGYGYEMGTHHHDAPHEECTCGIYAVSDESNAPMYGDVFGVVKLWGKIIPGDTGYRAEFAYPAELFAPSHLLKESGLLAYGVPVREIPDSLTRDPSISDWKAAVVAASQTSSNTSGAVARANESTRKLGRTLQRPPRWPIYANLACAGLNLAVVAWHFAS